MPRTLLTSGIELEYATAGDASDPAILLVNGYTSQMIVWDEGFIAGLVAQNLFVITYDNRDVGLSTKLDGQIIDPGAVLAALMAGGGPQDVPYTLSEMADDGMGLLDHLGIGQAHVAGVSMGGMIAQMMAIEHPTRVVSLTSIMSSPGDPAYGQPKPEARDALLATPVTEREAYIEQYLESRVWLSKKYFSEDATRQRAAASFDRAFYPEGGSRQLAAIYATGDRSERLRELNVATLVIHGRDDTLIASSGGERTAELIDGAHYLFMADMGHDLPIELNSLFTEAIGAHARVASCKRATSNSAAHNAPTQNALTQN